MSESCSCPMCLCSVDDTNKYTTGCNHKFCNTCIEMLFAYSSLSSSKLPNCPLCRQPLETLDQQYKIVIDIPPFHADNYPSSSSFEFIQNEHDRRMIQSAYECICQQNQWEILHSYVVDETRGFMFNTSDEITHLMTMINAHYQNNHSGCSLSIVMRFMHFIAKYGLEHFKTLYER